MPSIYVANATNQNQDFQYRLPESAKLMAVMIPIGEQRKLPGVTTTPDIEAVIQHHSTYGMINVGEIDRTRHFAGLCYSLDKPVDMARVLYVMEHNNTVLDERGRQIRQEAAIATNNAIEDQNKGLKAFEMEIIEDVKDGKDIEVNEKTRVSRTDQPTDPKARAKAR